MAKRAKRATHFNPRQDRNFPDHFINSRTPNNLNRRNYNNVIEFPVSQKKKKVEIIPKTLNQESLVAALEDNDKNIVFATGPAGTGKTFLSTLAAIKMLQTGRVQKIVITRPNVAVDDKGIGHLPGDIIKKLTPIMMPILDVFAEYYSQKEIAAMLEENIIEIIPIAFIRGRTFKSSFIIFDEAQNSTPSSMLSVLTRLGEGSKMAITGDISQGDRGKSNCLSDFIRRFTCTSERIELVKFEYKDIDRHPVIREILNLYKDMTI